MTEVSVETRITNLRVLARILFFFVLAWFQRLSLGILFCAHYMVTLLHHLQRPCCKIIFKFLIISLGA